MSTDPARRSANYWGVLESLSRRNFFAHVGAWNFRRRFAGAIG
jgi:hypothetical protein